MDGEKTTDNKPKRVLTVRMTSEMYQQVAVAALEAGVSKEKYIRDLITSDMKLDALLQDFVEDV